MAWRRRTWRASTRASHRCCRRFRPRRPRKRLQARWVLVGEDFRFGRGAGRLAVQRRRRVSASKRCARSPSTASARRARRFARRWPRATSATRRRYSVAITRSPAASRTATTGTQSRLPDGERAVAPRACIDGDIRRARAWTRGPAAQRRCERRRAADGKSGREAAARSVHARLRESIYGRRITVEFLHKLRERTLCRLNAVAGDRARRRRSTRIFCRARLNCRRSDRCSFEDHQTRPCPTTPAPTTSQR